MNKTDGLTYYTRCIAQQHQLSGVGKPKHPLFSVLRFEDLPKFSVEQRVKLIADFYQITLKTDCPCKMKYGKTQYDFDEGVMSFFAPKQLHIIEPGDWQPTSGWLLLIHPDFLRGYAIHQKMKEYGYFDYMLSEALILSEEEQKTIEAILLQIQKEADLPIDNFSQDVIISNLDLLLTYCNRYYNRQFIIRKPNTSLLINRVEELLNYYIKNAASAKGIPTATYLASQLNLSPKYLSDCLKQLTGQTTQQLIHDKLIEHAKDILVTTEHSVGEIAYLLGFEYPQSFSKLFKNKTNLTPVEYRQSFN